MKFVEVEYHSKFDSWNIFLGGTIGSAVGVSLALGAAALSRHLIANQPWRGIETVLTFILGIGGLLVIFLPFWILVIGMFTIPYAWFASMKWYFQYEALRSVGMAPTPKDQFESGDLKHSKTVFRQPHRHASDYLILAFALVAISLLLVAGTIVLGIQHNTNFAWVSGLTATALMNLASVPIATARQEDSSGICFPGS